MYVLNKLDSLQNLKEKNQSSLLELMLIEDQKRNPYLFNLVIPSSFRFTGLLEIIEIPLAQAKKAITNDDDDVKWSSILIILSTVHYFLLHPQLTGSDRVLSFSQQGKKLTEILCHFLLITVMKLRPYNQETITLIKDMCCCLSSALPRNLLYVLDEILSVLHYSQNAIIGSSNSKGDSFIGDFTINLTDLIMLYEDEYCNSKNVLGNKKQYDISLWSQQKIEFIQSAKSDFKLDKEEINKVYLMSSKKFILYKRSLLSAVSTQPERRSVRIEINSISSVVIENEEGRKDCC